MPDPADRYLAQDGASLDPPGGSEIADLPVFVVLVGRPPSTATLSFSYMDTYAVLAFNSLRTAVTLAQALEGKVYAMRLGLALEQAQAVGAVVCVVDEVNGLLLQFIHGERVSPTIKTRRLNPKEQATLMAITRPCGKG